MDLIDITVYGAGVLLGVVEGEPDGLDEVGVMAGDLEE